KGFTTNPTLMRKAGITDYRAFALDVLRAVPDRPISFEVFSDDFETMRRQALQIAGWGEHVYVKIPVTNTLGESSADLVREPARAPQSVPRRLDRLSHHHRHARHSQEGVARRVQPESVLARDREDVPRRRREGRLCAVTRGAHDPSSRSVPR